MTFPIYLIYDFLHWKLSKRSSSSSYWSHLVANVQRGHSLSLSKYLWFSFSVLVLNSSSTYIWYITLDKIPASINFALSHSEVLIVLLLSLWILPKGSIHLTHFRLITLFVLLIGLLLVAWGKAKSSTGAVANVSAKQWVTGVSMVLAATLLWGFYEVFFKKFFGSVSVAGVMLLQSLMGLHCLVFGGAVLVYFWLGKLEPVVQLTSQVWRFLIDSTLFSCSYFVVYSLALKLTSPFYVSFGSLLSLPISAVADHLLWNSHFPIITIIGMCVIVISVCLLNIQVNRLLSLFCFFSFFFSRFGFRTYKVTW